MNIKLPVLLFLIIATGFFSCKNKDLPLPVGRTTPLDVINATTDTLNFYLNGTRQNYYTDLFPGGAGGYINVLAGAQNYQFKRSGSPVVLFSAPYNLDTGIYHSIFIGGVSADKTFVTVDSLSAAQAALSADTTFTIAQVRFVNASASSEILNVSIIDSTKTRNINNCLFKYVGPFVSLKAGPDEFKIYLSGSTTPVIDTTITIQADDVYTLFTKGVLNGKGNNAFTLNLMTNAIY